jgi:hypothetical protein
VTSTINQGPRESVTNYYRRFVYLFLLLKSLRSNGWGKFYPEKLAVSASDADQENIARDKYSSMIFLAGADKAQFGDVDRGSE